MRNNNGMTIYTQRLAGFLMFKGFVLIAMQPDNSGSRRNVFHFRHSPEIEAAIQEYKYSYSR